MKQIKVLILSLLLTMSVTLPDNSQTVSHRGLQIGKTVAFMTACSAAGAIIGVKLGNRPIARLEKADPAVADLVRSFLNIPNSKAIDVRIAAPISEKDRAENHDIKKSKIAAGGLSAADASRLSYWDGGLAARANHTVIIDSIAHDLLLHPEHFRNEQECQKFIDIVRSGLQHEGGHLKHNDTRGNALFYVAATMGVFAAGEALYFFVKPAGDESKTGQLVRLMAEFGIINACCQLRARYAETRADEEITSACKKDCAKCLFFANKYYLDASGSNYNRKNLKDLLYATHPHFVSRIEKLWSIEECAEYMVNQEIEQFEHVVQKCRAELSDVAAKTEQEKIEYCIKVWNYSPDVTTWKETAGEILDKYPPILDNMLADKRSRREEEKQKLIAQMRDSISLTNNLKRLPRELASAGIKRVKQWWGKKEENKMA